MTNLRKTLTVIGPHGSEVTVLKPGLSQVIVIAQAGATVRGMRFYHPTLLNVSDITPASSPGRSPSPPSFDDQGCSQRRSGGCSTALRPEDQAATQVAHMIGA